MISITETSPFQFLCRLETHDQNMGYSVRYIYIFSDARSGPHKHRDREREREEETSLQGRTKRKKEMNRHGSVSTYYRIGCLSFLVIFSSMRRVLVGQWLKKADTDVDLMYGLLHGIEEEGKLDSYAWYYAVILPHSNSNICLDSSTRRRRWDMRRTINPM